MGKSNKANPFGEFIKAEHDFLRKSDPNYNKTFTSLFRDQSMNDKWKAMSEDGRQHYKEIAASKKDGTYYDQAHRHSSKFVEKPGAMSITDEPGKNSQACQQVSIRPDMKIQPKPKLGLPGKPHSKKMAKMAREGKDMPIPDDQTYEHMASYRLYNRCKDIIYSKSEEELLEAPLYTISCNVMCADNGNDDLYIPLEIAIYSYSMNKGRVKELYLTFVNPGHPPVGKMGEAGSHYRETNHKVPFAPIAPFLKYARSDYREIYKEILDYVGEERILLCQHADYLQQIHGVLKWLAKKANEKPKRSVSGLIKARVEQLPDADVWTVFDIKDYVYILGKRLRSPLPSDVYISMLLESLDHAYIADNNCEWHNKPENETKWCAKSCSKRLIANIGDLLEWFKTNYEAELAESKSLRCME